MNDNTLEGVLAVISAVFVLYTAMIDPVASLLVALIAIVCFVFYRMMFGNKTVKKVVVSKVAAKKISKTKKKK